MKKLLVSTAILAALTGGAFAQTTNPATNHPTPPAPQQASASLLDGLLADSTKLSASLSNVAQNLNSVDGSINIATGRDYTGMTDGMAALSGGTGVNSIPFGSYSQVGSGVTARDLPASLLNILYPLTLTVADLSTTAIGAMQSGSMNSTVNAGGIVDRVSTTATASTTAVTASADAYGGIANALAFQNVAANSGDVNGSVQLKLADVNGTVGKIGTTAIGAMGSGGMTASMSGNMGGVTSNTASIVTALIGN